MQSSNSSAPDRSFTSFLRRSLDVLRVDVPWAYARMLEDLGRREVAITVDDERVCVVTSPGGLVLAPAPLAPAVHVATRSRAIVDLIDAKSTLVDAVLAGDVTLRGSVDDLIAFHDALMAYLHGAVRSPAFPALLREFRRARGGDRPSRAAGSESKSRNGTGEEPGGGEND